jgi:hypothetical protein
MREDIRTIQCDRFQLQQPCRRLPLWAQPMMRFTLLVIIAAEQESAPFADNWQLRVFSNVDIEVLLDGLAGARAWVETPFGAAFVDRELARVCALQLKQPWPRPL